MVNDTGLPDKQKDFSKWYNKVITKAGLIDKRYNVKGMFVWLPFGIELILNIKKKWDELFKKNGIKEVYFPLLVPLEYANQNKEWFEGFKEEAFYVKGVNEEKHNTILRPTGEPAIYPMFSKWIRSYNELPLRIYETVSSFRYETKHTRPLIRDREITFWYEIHTVHASKKEAEQEIINAEKLNEEIYFFLGVKPLKVEKPSWEVFPGAVGATEFYTLMPNGRALENGSCNNLGQAYAKKFNIKFVDEKGNENFAWQTCTGNGARFLVSVIAQHGDNKGLVLPPNICNTKVVIVPIIFKESKEKILKKCFEIKKLLEEKGVLCVIDDSEKSAGEKFYEWELKGIPMRIEVGPKDIKKDFYPLFRRDTLEKIPVKFEDLPEKIVFNLKAMHASLLEKSQKFNEERLVKCSNLKDLAKAVKAKKIGVVYWCSSKKCWQKISGTDEGVELFGSIPGKTRSGKCIACQKETQKQGYAGKTY